MALRTRDIIDMEKDGTLAKLNDTGISVGDKVTSIFQSPQSPIVIGGWLKQQIIESGIASKHCISALATYLPDISSHSKTRRDLAITALTNMTKLAIDLTQNEFMKKPIIEIVCGAVHEPCDCEKCEEAKKQAATNPKIKPHVLVYSRETKYKQLCLALIKVIKNIRPTEDFYFALEVEPGDAYILNGKGSIEVIQQRITQKTLLSKHVGFNLDIAHMKIAGIQANDVKKFQERIIHAHIADHPGAHTSDQTVGLWTTILQHEGGFEGEYYPYFDILCKRWKEAQNSATGVPFSGVVALELEGGNRLLPIHHSITAIRRLIHTTKKRPQSE